MAYKPGTNPLAKNKTAKLTEAQQKRIDKLAKQADAAGMTPEQYIKKENAKAMAILGTVASIIPIGRVAQIANTAYKTYKAARLAKAAKSLKPKSGQVVAQAKPKPTSKATQDAAAAKRVMTQAKPKPKSGTSVTPSGGRAVKKPGSSVQQVRQVKDKKPDMKNVTPRQKALAGTSKDKIVGLSNRAKAGLATVAGLGAAAALSGKGEKKAKASTVQAPPSRPKRPTKKRSTGMSEGNTVAGMRGKKKPTPMSPGNTVAGAKGKPKTKTPTTKSRDKDGEGTGKINLPAGAKRKFGGRYDNKKEKLRNIGGKTYVFNK